MIRLFKQPHNDHYFVDPDSKILHPHLPCQVITISKAGTNLFIKLFNLMNCREYGPSSREEIRHMNPNALSHLTNDRNYILVVRDPRDKLISLANWKLNPIRIKIQKNQKIFCEESYQKLLNQTLDERVEQLFDASEYESVLDAKVKWPENVYILRFEDIIGPEYGGSLKDTQHLVVKKLSQLAHKTFSDEEIERLIQEMIGGTLTFTTNRKKVGQWKTLSTETITKIEDVYGKYIRIFGYA